MTINQELVGLVQLGTDSVRNYHITLTLEPYVRRIDFGRTTMTAYDDGEPQWKGKITTRED